MMTTLFTYRPTPVKIPAAINASAQAAYGMPDGTISMTDYADALSLIAITTVESTLKALAGLPFPCIIAPSGCVSAVICIGARTHPQEPAVNTALNEKFPPDMPSVIEGAIFTSLATPRPHKSLIWILGGASMKTIIAKQNTPEGLRIAHLKPLGP